MNPNHNPTDLKGGSGSGPYVRGEQITRIDQMKPGDIIICDCHQFDATNVARVKDVPVGFFSPGYGLDHVYAEFRDPMDTRRARLGSNGPFCIWHWELASKSYFKAVSEAAQGKLRVA